MLGEGLVIHQCILGEDADSLADVEVQASLILGLLHIVLAVRLIHVVTCLDVDSAVLWQLSQWGDNQSIYTLCLVADFCIQIAVLGVGIVEVGDALGKSLAGRVDVLRTYGPAVFLIFEREGVAVLVEAANLVGMSNLFGSTWGYARSWVCNGFCPVTLSRIRTGPSEGTDTHAAYWHQPYTTNHILLIINVLGVGALTVEYAHLIVQQVSAVGILEEITLKLQTDVTTVGSVLSGTVTETCQLAHVLGISHEALVDRVHRILKGEWVLELTNLHLEVLILLPFSK